MLKYVNYNQMLNLERISRATESIYDALAALTNKSSNRSAYKAQLYLLYSLSNFNLLLLLLVMVVSIQGVP